MREVGWDLVVDGFGKLEGPAFDAAGRLCVIDRSGPGRILRLEADGTTSELAERSHGGGLVAHACGGLVVSGHRVTWIADDGTEQVLLEAGDGWGFNDLTTDVQGRVFVGRFDTDPMPPAMGEGGSLWRISSGGEAALCYDGIALTNGLGLAPDGSVLYHNDTTPRTVWVSALTPDGWPVDRRPLCVLDGSPDGMAVDETGCLWIALMGSGRIVRITPDGKEDTVINAPREYTASVCFDGRDLYAVTFGGEPYDPRHSGAVFRTTLDVAGAPVHPARVQS